MVTSSWLLFVLFFFVLFCSIGVYGSSSAPKRAYCGFDAIRQRFYPKPVSPEQIKRELEGQEHMANLRKRDASHPVFIPINYHILYNNNQGLLDNLLIYYQTYVLNQAHNRYGYYYWTKSIEKISTPWTNDCQTNTDTIDTALGVNPVTELNVYSCVAVGLTDSGADILGFAFLPSNESSRGYRNGVFVWYKTFPNAGAAYYSQGDTLVHEVGHYLGLYHPFEGGCTYPNDLVDDTPACLANTGIDCPSNADTCPTLDPGMFDDVHNYMDYSIDSCFSHLTLGQVARIDHQVATFRPLLFSNVRNASDPPMSFPDFIPNPNGAEMVLNWWVYGRELFE